MWRGRGGGGGSPPAGWYASPSGDPGNAGTFASPWDLQTALDGGPSSEVQPDDTIWMRGGTYTGFFENFLTGTNGHPIKVQAYPAERPTIDSNVYPAQLGNNLPGLICQDGAYTWFIGIEFFNSMTDRWNPTPGSNPEDRRNNAFANYDNGMKFINCVIHDCGEGVQSWSGSSDVEVYGCLVYHNGWQAPDRWHGHGFYSQCNSNPGMTGKHNIFYDQLDGVNIHTYGSGAARWLNSNLTENFWVNEAAIGGEDGFLLTNSVLEGNYAVGGALNFGYHCTDLTDTSLLNNYISVTGEGLTALDMDLFTHPEFEDQVTMTGNTVIGNIPSEIAPAFPANTYRARTDPPTSNVVSVWPNAYETNRANVIVYNWEDLTHVHVDLSSAVANGTNINIYHAQDFYNTPVYSGQYNGGTVEIPLTGLTAEAGYHYTAAGPTMTDYKIAAFIVREQGV